MGKMDILERLFVGKSDLLITKYREGSVVEHDCVASHN